MLYGFVFYATTDGRWLCIQCVKSQKNTHASCNIYVAQCHLMSTPELCWCTLDTRIHSNVCTTGVLASWADDAPCTAGLSPVPISTWHLTMLLQLHSHCHRLKVACTCRAQRPEQVVCSEQVTVCMPQCGHQHVVACHEASAYRSDGRLCNSMVQVSWCLLPFCITPPNTNYITMWV
jgi:hypothetical protein